MSYCRWSSDGWRCDVYVYKDVSGGWTTHVAGRKRVHPEPCPQLDWDAIRDRTKDEKVAAIESWQRAERAWLDQAQMVDIGLPHDGARFNDDTAGDCANTLEMLRAAGYWVPQYAIDSLREDDGAERTPRTDSAL